MITTTLNKLRAFSPCRESWEKFLRFKGKTHADDEEFPLVDVLTSNGFQDTIWALKVAPDIAIKFAHECANHVQHLDNYWSKKAADTTHAANAHAYAAAAYAATATYATYAAAERKWQTDKLTELLTNTP